MERTVKVDIDEMTDRVVEKTLDEFLYKGKTIREWVELMVTAESVVEVRMIEELEKITAEFENMWIKSAKDLRTGEVIYENLCEHSEVLEIIDKHIAELKGENK